MEPPAPQAGITATRGGRVQLTGSAVGADPEAAETKVDPKPPDSFVATHENYGRIGGQLKCAVRKGWNLQGRNWQAR